MSNQVKTKFLGMNYGTASGQLRKMIIFQLVQETKRDVCFRCGEMIESIEDLSIEHKMPWLHKDVKLFWDLNNIAFSHLKCNIPHTRGTLKLRKVGEEGTAWCSGHKDFLPVGQFSPDLRHWNGVHSRCRPCHNKKPLAT